MTSEEQYLEEVGLLKLLTNFQSKIDKNQLIMYNKSDLVYLHKLVRSKKSFTSLEFGVGFSTIVIAHAHYMNKIEFDSLTIKKELRNSQLFKHFVVESNEFWLANTKANFPETLKDFVSFNFSECRINLYNGQICSLYDSIPNIVPDFIYLDGPDPLDVKGEINGINFSCKERTIISGDILLLESTLLPGTNILVDGRVNNCRFLKNNFKRNFKFYWDKEGDRTLITLEEERLGKYNILGSDFFSIL